MRKIALLLPVIIMMGNALVRGQQSYESIKMPQLMPPSPEAFQLGSYGTLPVGLFTGTMNFSIPLYEVRTRNLSLPITVNYNSNGVKVDLPSSRVGTGWVMQAGGVINRTVYGKEDFVNPRPALPASFTNPSNQLRTYLESIMNGDDSQADMYSFNFNGYSGSFYFTRTGEIVSVPYQANLRITKNPGTPTAWDFKVVTPDGVTYFFGGTGAKEKSKTQSGGAGCSYTNYPFIDNAWYLNKIVHPFGDSIMLSYNSVSYSYISGFSQSVEKKYPTTQSSYTCPRIGTTDVLDPPADSWSTCYTTTTNNGCILSSITFPDGMVRFSNANRFDLPGDSCVSAFTVYGRNQIVPVKIIDFEQMYTSANTSYNNSVVTDNGGSQRLFLTAVKELHPHNNGAGRVHSFQYYDTANLAPRLSMAQDHFGYFNGASNTYFVPATTDFSNLFSGFGGNRAPDFSYASRGMLKKIIYPTGGYHEIFYEQNSLQDAEVTYLKQGQAVVNGHLDVGGVRVAKVTSYDTVANKRETRKFLYTFQSNPTQSSGDLVWQPIYISDKIVHKNCAPIINGNVSCGYAHFPMKVLHSNSIYPLYATPNGTVVYNEVVESLGENFENGGIRHRCLVDADAIPQVLHGNQIPSGNTTNFGTFNGLEKETLYFSLVAGNVVKRKEAINRFTHLNGLNASTSVFKIDTGIIVNRLGTLNCQETNMTQNELDLYDINRYYTYSGFTFSDTAFVYEYDDKGQNPLLVTSVIRYDNVQNLQKTAEKTFTSAGDTLINEYKYAYDFKSAGNVYQKMFDANFNAAVVETKSKKNTTTLDIVKTNYSDWYGNNKILVPLTVEYTHTSNPAVTRIQYHNYSSKGEMLEASQKDNVHKSYIWNISASYPLAEVTNAAAGEIAFTSFEDDGNGNWSYSGIPKRSADNVTGRKVYQLSTGNLSKTGLSSSAIYVVSYWTKNASAFSITGTQSGFPVSGQTVNGWKYFEHRITGQTQVTLSGTGIIDEVRLYPAGGEMNSYTYDPLVGITSQCDANNGISYFEYDEFARLILVRNQNRQVVKKICYNYAGQAEGCSVFYNVQKSQDFYRNNCSPPLSGSLVTYTVEAGVYSSTISQAEADTLALMDVAANGQAFANANGTCSYVCNFSNCSGADKLCVNNVCETGFKVYTSSTYNPGTGMYECTYHYEFSNGSWSPDYVDYSPIDCVIPP
jgi:hypothetical protein